MLKLSAKVNTDRERGGVSRSVYTGYLKACGLFVVAAALALSLLAQVSRWFDIKGGECSIAYGKCKRMGILGQ